MTGYFKKCNGPSDDKLLFKENAAYTRGFGMFLR